MNVCSFLITAEGERPDLSQTGTFADQAADRRDHSKTEPYPESERHLHVPAREKGGMRNENRFYRRR